jgi:hypothetical protein
MVVVVAVAVVVAAAEVAAVKEVNSKVKSTENESNC